MIVTSKENIKTALLAYEENEIAMKAESLTDEQVLEIGKMSVKYMAENRLIDKMLALAAVEYFEGTKRELKKNRRDMKCYKESKNEGNGFLGRMLKLINKK